jgi:hypothetical protein
MVKQAKTHTKVAKRQAKTHGVYIYKYIKQIDY